MEEEVLNQIKQDKRFSFEGELIIRTEGKSKYIYNKQGKLLETTYADDSKDVYDKQGNLLEETYADGSKDVYKFGIKIQIAVPAVLAKDAIN